MSNKDLPKYNTYCSMSGGLVMSDCFPVLCQRDYNLFPLPQSDPQTQSMHV